MILSIFSITHARVGVDIELRRKIHFINNPPPELGHAMHKVSNRLLDLRKGETECTCIQFWILMCLRGERRLPFEYELALFIFLTLLMCNLLKETSNEPYDIIFLSIIISANNCLYLYFLVLQLLGYLFGKSANTRKRIELFIVLLPNRQQILLFHFFPF